MIEIREFRVGDEEALGDLFGAVLPDFNASVSSDGEALATFLREPTSFALGAYLDGSPVGLAWGMQMRSPSGRLTTYLHQLDVLEGSRRQGVASSLIIEAMALARRIGSTKFWLSTGAHNEGALALYGSLGGERKPQGDVNHWWSLT
jgi:ribosomal protein S18 acetylase RimI-like enzyme